MLPTLTAGEKGAVLWGLVVRNWGAWASATAGARTTAATAINRRIFISLWEGRKWFLVVGRWSLVVSATAVCRPPSAVYLIQCPRRPHRMSVMNETARSLSSAGTNEKNT